MLLVFCRCRHTDRQCNTAGRQPTLRPACVQGEQQQQGAEADAGLVRRLLAAAMHSRAAYGYAMQVS
jgi:hypothetical protein